MRLIPILLLVGLVGCNNSDVTNPTSPSPTTPPTTSTTPVTTNKIEFRVTGNAGGVRVRMSNPVDGLTQVVTTLPYVATITTTQSDMFLSLEATPTFWTSNAFPFMQVQIFVNGALFREASTSDFFLTTISVSGNWRK